MKKTMNDLKALLEAAKGKKILVVSHRDPDGDAIGSTVALTLALEALGHGVYALNRNELPERYAFLDPEGKVKTLDTLEDKSQVLAFVLDSGDLGRLGFDLKATFPQLETIVNIDHHKSNSYFGDLNLVDLKAAANCQILYGVIKDLGVSISPAMANALYTGITTDTGSFKYESTSPETMQVGACLMKEGADHNLIRKNIYESEPFHRIQALSQVLANLSISEDKKLAWISISQADIQKLGLKNDDLETFVDYPRTLNGVEVALFLKELEDNFVKVSVRTRSKVDATKVAGIFDGGGHKRAAGFRVNGALAQVEKAIIDKVKKAMKEG